MASRFFLFSAVSTPDPFLGEAVFHDEGELVHALQDAGLAYEDEEESFAQWLAGISTLRRIYATNGIQVAVIVRLP